uniref:Defensin-like protein n=1 Tax=Rhizophora mucronata TaxID=61149 RepID=A0A2P2IKJ8_RHIMU
MLPQQWAPSCGSQCTCKYAALTQIPWRVFCKKGCDTDSETWEECLAECDHICYKDPVFKDKQWSSYIDRSPGASGYSEACFLACVAGCGYRFEIDPDTVDQVRPNRPCKPPPLEKPTPVQKQHPVKPDEPIGDIPCTSA